MQRLYLACCRGLTEKLFHRNDCPEQREGFGGGGMGGDDVDTDKNPSKNTSDHFVYKCGPNSDTGPSTASLH